ncbi:hypothetical protein ACIOC2_27580 [Streptomyces sp. NPDC088337]|uniref:hypothetical protein n=1 Tax=unclassified Streptomyces TaxID=2593676 RepID=UPI002DDBE3D1|nr:hypothetical protein [Streptomyces sp. NBC_01788]WSB29568.1 hypothetical protein OIE49_28765 [Streptomyces sp. NBC_01788]
MAATGTPPPLSVAASAALAVPGVAGLQPRLAHRLTAAALPAGPETTAQRTPEAGVRVDRVPDGSGWHVEVRCVLTEGHRAVDTARNVHDQVRAAVLSYLAAHDAPVAVTVTVRVTVTRITARDHTV